MREQCGREPSALSEQVVTANLQAPPASADDLETYLLERVQTRSWAAVR